MFEFHSFVEYVMFVKKIEYALAFAMMFGFLLLYKSAKTPAERRAAVAVVKGLPVPENLVFHPGHSWARIARGGAVIGLDVFARRLLGRISAVVLPSTGTVLRRGETAWTLFVDGRRFDIASPVDGIVAEVNPALSSGTDALNDDPQGAGWMVRVHTRRRSIRGLLSGKAAREWLQKTVDELYAATHMDFGTIAADGGEPIDGLAKAIDPEHWDDVARRYLNPQTATGTDAGNPTA